MPGVCCSLIFFRLGTSGVVTMAFQRTMFFSVYPHKVSVLVGNELAPVFMPLLLETVGPARYNIPVVYGF